MTADPASGADATPGPVATPGPAAETRHGPPPTTLVVTLVPLAVAVNFIANVAIAPLGLPIYLDTTGTFLASVLLGPWWGALVGVLTNVLGIFPYGPTNVLFAPVNVVAALLWGYGVRRLGLGRSAIPFFALAVAVGVATAAVATPIVLWLGGSTGHASDLITALLSGFGLALAVFLSSVITSVPDKVISAYAGLAITAALPTAVASRARLPEPPGPRRVVVAIGGIVVGIVLTIIAAALLPLINPPSA